jgi:UDP-N-acetylglucosamine--N-acetylmuramyl-(pentapeptide) pyrophosphoryl-undecaprenol N-acetylglucosamine transferase
LPVALAAWIFRIPVLIYLPDIEPGMTIKMLRRFARKVAITVPESARYFRDGQTVVTGYPLRESVREATREQGIEHFGLDPERKTLLIFGESRGSRAINVAIGDILTDVLDDGIQVIHLTGTLDWERTQEQIGALRDHEHYHACAYCDEIGLALQRLIWWCVGRGRVYWVSSRFRRRRS